MTKLIATLVDVESAGLEPASANRSHPGIYKHSNRYKSSEFLNRCRNLELRLCGLVLISIQPAWNEGHLGDTSIGEFGIHNSPPVDHAITA